MTQLFIQTFLLYNIGNDYRECLRRAGLLRVHFATDRLSGHQLDLRQHGGFLPWMRLPLRNELRYRTHHPIYVSTIANCLRNSGKHRDFNLLFMIESSFCFKERRPVLTHHHLRILSKSTPRSILVTILYCLVNLTCTNIYNTYFLHITNLFKC